MRSYLAGGVVRDLLLGRTVRDVDLVVEGDALGFARRLAVRLDAALRAHERFATATLSGRDRRRLDVAATRRERYLRSGALPEVTPGASIEQDLARRDFSINALALELSRRPRLIDPFGGREDLRRGLVRILHERSFLDDPTRILRAVRYAARLGFALARATRERLVEAVAQGALGRISPDRLRREIRLLLEEPERRRALALMRRLGVDAAVHPALARRGADARLVRIGPGADWLGALRAWLGESDGAEVAAVAERLGLSRAERAELAGRAGASEPPAVRGADLIAAGVPPGPAIGRALARTRDAVAKGRLARDEALAFALRTARGEDS